MNHANFRNLIRKQAAPDTVLFTMQSGMFYTKQGNPCYIGVEGMSDLVGWTSVVITPDMVGKKVAIYTAAETKVKKDRLRPEQINFIDAVKAAGGYAGEVRSIDDLIAIKKK